MANQTFLTFSTSSKRQVLKTAVSTSGGGSDAGKIPCLDTNGKLAANMMPTGFGEDIVNMACSEALAAGDFVNVFDDSGDAKVRKASAADTTKPAHGFVKTSTTNPGDLVDVYFEGGNDQLTGMTAGVEYFLSASTAGAKTATPPSSTGNVIQRLGVAASASNLNFEASYPPIEIE